MLFINKQTADLQAESAAVEQPVAIYAGRELTRGQLWADVRKRAETLPARDFVINLCQNRYLFLLTLLAAAVRRQVCLLPPSAQAGVLAEICADYPGAYCVSEQRPEIAADWLPAAAPETLEGAAPLAVDWQQAKLIAFTSGSSGKPQAHGHSLETFRISAGMATRRLGLENQPWLIVSTTPPQHMYGLETSIFWPLFSRLILHDGRPFFAEDLRQALSQTGRPAVLVTTPAHLRHLAGMNPAPPNLVRIISATDTLSEKLARQTQDTLGRAPVEIYGSTETLSFASRQMLESEEWQLYEACSIYSDAAGTRYLAAAHLPKPVPLQDDIRPLDGEHFSVSGRHHDMVKVAGKRASLADLNRRLRDIDGVADGFFYVIPGTDHGGRLGAVVVSGLDKFTIKQALAPFLDEVFMPKRLHFVASIPRNQAGKLTKAEQELLLRSVGVELPRVGE